MFTQSLYQCTQQIDSKVLFFAQFVIHLPTPLSMSLPITHFGKLSPPLPPFTLPSQLLVEEEDDKKECEDCEFIKRVKDIKDDWKKGVEEISNDDVMKNYLKEVGIQSEKLAMNQVNEEIKRLEDSLNKLNHKKERIIADLNMMNEDKEKITQSTFGKIIKGRVDRDSYWCY